MSRMKDFGAWLRAGWVGSSDAEVLRSEEPAFVRTLPKLSNTVRNRKVVHESGHALVAWLCTHTFVTELDVEAASGNGKVAYSVIMDPRRTSEVSWARVVIGVAGIAGELKMLGNFRSGHSAADLTLARQDAREVRSVPRLDIPPATLFDKNIFATPLSPTEKQIFNSAYALAKYLLVEHEDLYLKLVRRCMKQDRLNEEEINEAIGSREPVFFLRNLGVLTFLMKGRRG